jgi:hypothetical protein
VNILPDYRKPEAFQKEAGNDDEKECSKTDEIFWPVIEPGWTGDISSVECQSQSSQAEECDDVQQERKNLADWRGESESELNDHDNHERKNESEEQEQVDETRVKVLKDFAVEDSFHDEGPDPCSHGVGPVLLSSDFPQTDALLETVSE